MKKKSPILKIKTNITEKITIFVVNDARKQIKYGQNIVDTTTKRQKSTTL